MKTGKFYSKEGIYEFDGKHYKPRRYANQLKTSIPEVYTLCIDGFNNLEPKNWPYTVLVTHNYLVNGIKPVEELRKHYDGIYAQSQLHAYAVGVAGQLPDWTLPWVQSKFMLIHEYAPGTVAWMRPDDKFANDIYMFMVDCAGPADQPIVDPPADPPIVIPTGTYKVTGKIWKFNVDLTVKREE